MPDTADNPQAAGQPDVSAHDVAVQHASAEVVRQASAQPDEGVLAAPEVDSSETSDPWADPAVARREIEKLRRESATWRTKFREAEPRLTEYQQWQESQKTEQQKLADAKQAAEQQLTDLRSTNARLLAAATYNIPPDLIDLLGAGSDEEISARAELLAERLKAAAPAPAPAAQRPVEALTPGAAPASSSAAVTPDQWIRRLSGRTP